MNGRVILSFIVVLLTSFLTNTNAQLVECDQVNSAAKVTAANGCIARPLDQQIGTGHGDINTPNSSIYLINRDPARSIRRGRQLFQRKFTLDEGLGPRVNRSSTGDITENRALGAGFADSCAACHGRPKGAAGFGGDVATRPDSRDAPHLFGLGIVEQLAEEMTEELRQQRDRAIAAVTNTGNNPITVRLYKHASFRGHPVVLSAGEYTMPRLQELGINDSLSSIFIPAGVTVTLYDEDNFAGAQLVIAANKKLGRNLSDFNNLTSSLIIEAEPQQSSGPRTIALSAKGIDFGQLTVLANGEVDTSKVEGVDEDLRVLPFFHQGGTASIREFIIGALKDEMGMQAWDPILCAVTDPENPQPMISPSGFEYNPDLDEFERPPLCDPAVDGDLDGVTAEIDPALVDHMEFYLLNYFKPGVYKQTPLTRIGRRMMDEAECTTCHVADLVIESDRRVADVETNYNSQDGIFNDLFAQASTRFAQPINDGDAYPILPSSGEPFVVRNFFSDLKRHDLGEAFHEREYDGTMVAEFVTEPLWGVGSTAPYGHDGRSINLDAVIRRHGGEAERSRQLYENLSFLRQLALRDFLNSLVLFPPDDTASNLNPGDPSNVVDIQDPNVHGNIRLPALFQIPELGSE